MNPKDPKVFIFLVPFVAVVAIFNSIDQTVSVDFIANGRVVAVKPTANHGEPIVAIKFTSPPYTRQFFPSKNFIVQSKIKSGDHFIKKSKSKYCSVNGEEFQCL